MKKIDVAIIGAGTAGLSARKEVAKKTQNYLVIDPGPLGTTCARVGCMPSKVLIQVANDFDRRHKFAEMGISGAENITVDTQAVMRHVRKLRDRFVRAVVKDTDTWRSTHYKQAKARFVAPHVLDLGDEKIEAQKIIIATGSQPIIPKAWEKYSSYFIDTNSFFELETLPQKIAIIGLGVIGIELGQALARLGVSVTGIDLKRSVGALSDPEILDYAIKTFSKEMPLYFSGAEIVKEEATGLRIKSGDFEEVFEKVFVSMGRKPNLAELGLEEIGVPLDERKIPIFDSKTFRVKDFPIYIAGDVNAQRPILHEAADQGRIAGHNSVEEEDQCYIPREKLGIVFTDPNIAGIGKNYQELIKEEANFVTGKVSYEGQGRAIVKLKEKGLVHIYAHKKNGKLLGAEMFAPEGEHLAHLLSWAISLKLNVFQVLSLPFYHPVLEEGLRTALRNLALQVEDKEHHLEVLRCQDAPAGA